LKTLGILASFCQNPTVFLLIRSRCSPHRRSPRIYVVRQRVFGMPVFAVTLRAHSVPERRVFARRWKSPGRIFRRPGIFDCRAQAPRNIKILRQLPRRPRCGRDWNRIRKLLHHQPMACLSNATDRNVGDGCGSNLRAGSAPAPTLTAVWIAHIVPTCSTRDDNENR
jgi:hypothetical protein